MAEIETVPAQGNWTEKDYLGPEDHLGGSIRVELSQGSFRSG